MDKSALLAAIKARRTDLCVALAHAEAHASAIRGGIAELDYLIETVLPFDKAPALQTELKRGLPPAGVSGVPHDTLCAARQSHEAPRD